MNIIPAILVSTYQELSKQLTKTQSLFDYVQLDIMDGNFVKNKSFNYNENKNLVNYFNNELKTDLKYELHLMVNNPLQAIKQWQPVNNVFRVIFHIESQDDPNKVIKLIKNNNWQVGIAINPNTPNEKVVPYLDKLNLVLFMTVHPGRQGSSFVREVKEKIIKFAKITNHPNIAVDGGINQDTIKEVKSWGVDIFNIGSALMNSNNLKQQLKKLKSICN